MPGIKPGFEDKAYWNQKASEYSAYGIRAEGFEETNDIWDYFKYCLQTGNRFFFDNPLLPLITHLFERYTFVLEKGTTVYRARIDQKKELSDQCWLAKDYADLQLTDPESPFAEFYKSRAESIANNPEFQEFKIRYIQGFEGFDAKDSGLPPFDKVSAGRCNPEHVPLLYIASDIHTATAEVRPFIRDSISIAELNVVKDLRLVDFHFEYNEDGYREIDNIFFDKIRQEFSAVNKGEKEKYLTTQYITALIKQQGFDGIRFKSSLVEQGANYVIFDAENCSVVSSKMYILRKVEYDLFEMLSDYEKDLLKD